ncbi:hypothetical protein BGW39_008412 [Mortierella sp. 14UC]|nr:hypothetical protein BGW39_008412 [Mortierella sp. 14UC]
MGLPAPTAAAATAAAADCGENDHNGEELESALCGDSCSNEPVFEPSALRLGCSIETRTGTDERLIMFSSVDFWS